MPEEGASTAATPDRLMSSKAALSVLNSVLGAVLGTTALVFIAKNMGPSVLGILGYAMASVGILSFLSDFGMGSVHRTHIKHSIDVAKCIGAYAAIRLTLLAIFAVITFFMIELWKDGYMGAGMPTDSYVLTQLVDSMYVFLVYYILLGISQIATHTFDALDASAKVQVPAILELIVRVVFVIYVATSVMGSSYNGPALLSAAYAAGMITSVLLVALLMRRYPISVPDRMMMMSYIRSLVPVFVVSVTIILDLYLDKWIVGYFWGETELGLYFGVQRMAVFVGVFSLSVATLILPSVTTYFIKNDVGASWDVVNQAERYVSLVVIPTAAFYLVFGSDILRIFLTEEFSTAITTMNILVLAGAVLALVLPLRSVIAGVGRPVTLFMVGTGGLLVQLALMIILVPKTFLGIPMLGLKGTGAGLALLATSIFYFFTLRYMAWRIGKILPNSRSFRHLLSAIAMVASMYVVRWLVVPSIDWISLIFLAIIGTISYGSAAYLLGELDSDDYRYFRKMLNPQDTYQYVVNELLGKRV
ncbi:MAG: polysaccharide biosynthesis C-terminal domain-containing protein [Thermoplasmata archaeon]|nr:polysaccharide biosynthesis C-terminal domain-containing protein [Thermoplasmata archaeon]